VPESVKNPTLRPGGGQGGAQGGRRPDAQGGARIP
jgi:hypothetical protein